MVPPYTEAEKDRIRDAHAILGNTRFTGEEIELILEAVEIEYDQSFKVRKVRHGGEIKWQGHLLYLSQVLAKQPIGLKQIAEDQWAIYYSFYLLGYWNERKQKLESKKTVLN